MGQQYNSEKILWFVAGAAIGASVALLYAPQAGRVTRRILNKKTREGREAVTDTGRSLAETGRSWFEKGRDLYEQARRVADEGAELFERGRKLMEG